MLLLSTRSDFSNSVTINVASNVASNQAGGSAYASRYGAGLLLFGFVFSVGITRRRKLLLLLAAAAVSAVFLVSCGSGGSSSSPSTGNAATGASGVASYTVSGLSSKATYFWKVEAVDNTGQQVESPASSFVTD
ncbi:MAG: hypothetical protein M0033_11290 [Nitrospiraceae bacterium]|nr:hypothetical protein [Nitrospiraceae bacterium]